MTRGGGGGDILTLVVAQRGGHAARIAAPGPVIIAGLFTNITNAIFVDSRVSSACPDPYPMPIGCHSASGHGRDQSARSSELGVWQPDRDGAAAAQRAQRVQSTGSGACATRPRAVAWVRVLTRGRRQRVASRRDSRLRHQPAEASALLKLLNSS
ncbi:hypothetical protein evm_011343 [Chilo suppressalis]|nr:hypothetical protein evm_011343 [Chilo suppressalis]